jgi:molybdenum cofactor cytidylyltransferase
MQIKLDAIILSAGKSGRIGEPKAFLEFDGKPFIINILEKLLPFCNRIVIVFGYEAEKMIELISREKVYRDNQKKIFIEINEDYEKGMFSSIKTGLKKIYDAEYVLIHQVDQPALPKKFYEEFISQIDERIDWLQPSFSGRNGHPIIINQKVVNLIVSEKFDSSLRILKNENSIVQKIWKCNYPEIHQDIDTIEDYKKLLEG